MLNSGSSVSTTDGNISLISNAGGTSTGDFSGIVLNDADLTTTTGNITLNGTGGTGTNSNFGVLLQTSSIITSEVGNIDITGLGGNGTGTNNYGIELFGNSQIRSTGIGTNAATIALDGTGGTGTDNNHGVILNTSSIISSSDILAAVGTIDLTGTEGTGGQGINLENASTIGNGTTTGAITFTSDTVNLANSTLQSTGDLTIQPRTAGTTLGIGDGSTGTLNLGTTEIASFTNGFANIILGDATTGAVDIQTVTFNDPVTINSAFPLNLGGTFTINNEDLTLNLPINLTNNATIDTGTGNLTLGDTVNGSFNLNLNSTANTTINGEIGTTNALTGFTTDAGGTTQLNSNITTIGAIAFNDPLLLGNDITLDTGVGAGDITLNTVTGLVAPRSLVLEAGTGNVTFANTVGAGGLINNLTANGQTITLNSDITTGSGDVDFTASRNIALNATSSITTTTGNINLSANTAGTTTGTFVGINLNGGNLNSTTGAINLTGTGGDTGGGNHGIRQQGGSQVTTTGAITYLGTSGVGTAGDNDGIRIDGGVTTLVSSQDGDVTDSGNLNIAGTTNVDTAGNNITLDEDNNFSIFVGSNANNLTIHDVDSLDLGNLEVARDLTVTTAGDVTDSGNLNVVGITNINSNGNNVTLDNGNDFNTVSISNTENGTLNDVNNLDLGRTEISGDLTVTTTGDVTDSGNLNVAGTTNINSNGSNITLDSQNDFNTISITNTQNATLNDINNLDLGETEIRGDLTITTAGDVTDSGNVNVAGITTINPQGNNIILDNNNDFNTISIVNANNVQLNEINDINLGDTTAAGNFLITAVGTITDSGNLVLNGSNSFVSNRIELDNFTGTDTLDFNTTEDLILTYSGDITLGSFNVGGNVNIHNRFRWQSHHHCGCKCAW